MNKQISKLKIIIGILTAIFAVISLIKGLENFHNIKVDWQLKNTLILFEGESPYKSWYEKTDLFVTNVNKWQWPTSLPLLFVITLPFGFNEHVLEMLYILIGLGVLFLFIYRIKDERVFRRYIAILLLLFISTSYRNNLGNGQWLFFVFPLALFYFYDTKINRWLKYLLLSLMSTKISLFPFAILLVKKRDMLITLGMVFFINLIAFAIFLNWTDTGLIENIGYFVSVLQSVTEIKSSGGAAMDLISFEYNPVLGIINLLIFIIATVGLTKGKLISTLFMLWGLALLNIVGQFLSYDYFVWLIPFIDPSTILKREGNYALIFTGIISLEWAFRIIFGMDEFIYIYSLSHSLILFYVLREVYPNLLVWSLFPTSSKILWLGKVV